MAAGEWALLPVAIAISLDEAQSARRLAPGSVPLRVIRFLPELGPGATRPPPVCLWSWHGASSESDPLEGACGANFRMSSVRSDGSIQEG